jgi:hypothetical protein
VNNLLPIADHKGMSFPMIENIQQKFHEAFSSWIDAGAPPQCVVCFGIIPNDELPFPAVAVVNDVPYFPSWW